MQVGNRGRLVKRVIHSFIWIKYIEVMQFQLHLREMHIMNDLGHAYPTGQQDLNNDYFGALSFSHTHACRDTITPAQKFGQNHTASPDAPVAAVSFHKAREHLFIIPPKHSAAALRRRPFRCAFERY